MFNNYNFNKNIKFLVPKDVMFIIKKLEEHGFEAYAVGGCVRDMILKRTPQDWDITTSALPMQVKEIFHRTIDTGLKHGTVTVMLKGVGYEVTTYRIDGKYTDGRHPESVEFTCNLIEDLKRRDFTINALAYNPTYGLVDAFQGIKDMEKKVITCVGKAEERFMEDALRILRAVRFSAQLGFDIEKNTQNAITKLAPNLVNISKERIYAELEKLILSGHPEKLADAYRFGITKYILPEFDKMMECPQNSKYHMYNVGEHTIKVMENVPAEHYLRWAALLHDVGKPAVRTRDKDGVDHFKKHGVEGKNIAISVMKKLKMDNKTIGIVSRLVECHDRIQNIPMNEVAVRKSIYGIKNDIYPMFLTLAEADYSGKSEYGKESGREKLEYTKATYQKIIRRGDCYCTKMLAIAGRDLIQMNIGPGPIVGDVLDYLLIQVINEPKLNTKEKLKELAVRYMKKQNLQ